MRGFQGVGDARQIKRAGTPLQATARSAGAGDRPPQRGATCGDSAAAVLCSEGMRGGLQVINGSPPSGAEGEFVGVAQ